MNERPSWPERVLAGFRPVRGGRRQSWALGAVALALAVLIAATLLLAGRVLQRSAVPASRAAASPAAAEPPPAISRYALSSPTLGPDGAGWVLERAQQPPHTGETTVWRTVDRGAHWWRQLDLPAGVAELHSGAGDQALIDVTAVYSGPGAAVTALFYSTSDGGAHWQRFLAPTPEPVLAVPVKDAREAWVIADVFFSPPRPTTQRAVYHTVDGARTWLREATVDLATTFGYPVFFSGAFSGQYGVFAPQIPGTTRGRIFTTSDGGVHWQSVSPPTAPGETVDAPILLPDGHLVAFHAVTVSVSDDGGLHWSPPRQAPASGRPTGLDSTHWWWIATDGPVFFSRNEGAAWTRVGSLPRGMTLSAGSFSSPTDGVVIASYLRSGLADADNVLLATADGGRTWRPIDPPHPYQPAVPCGPEAIVSAHVVLRMTLDGRADRGAVPAGVGVADGCRYRLFTPDRSGTIDIASTPSDHGRTYTLGDFLDVWGVPDVQSIDPYRGPETRVSVLVNGRAYPGDPRTIPLRDGTRIVVKVTGPTSGGPAPTAPAPSKR